MGGSLLFGFGAAALFKLSRATPIPAAANSTGSPRLAQQLLDVVRERGVVGASPALVDPRAIMGCRAVASFEEPACASVIVLEPSETLQDSRRLGIGPQEIGRADDSYHPAVAEDRDAADTAFLHPCLQEFQRLVLGRPDRCGVSAIDHLDACRFLTVGEHAHNDVSVGQHAYQAVAFAADGQHAHP